MVSVATYSDTGLGAAHGLARAARDEHPAQIDRFRRASIAVRRAAVDRDLAVVVIALPRCAVEGWGDVDWDGGRIVVRSSKTEHHEGGGVRVMPLFPELRPYLQAVLDELLADFDPKQKRLSEQPIIVRYRGTNTNLRTQLCKIIRKAGLTVWPKLFQNLRATRATELADQFPAHVAADWLGHSTTIADKHYRQTTDEHFTAALTVLDGNLQIPMQSGAVASTQGDVEKTEPVAITEDYDRLRYLTPLQVGDTGLEPVTSAV